MNTIGAAVRSDLPPQVDIAELVPQPRHVLPVELTPGDLLFDTSGTPQRVDEISVLQSGKIVSALLANNRRVWFRSDEPIIAVLPRTETPTITVYERVFDPEDEAGWAQGDPRVMDTETGRTDGSRTTATPSTGHSTFWIGAARWSHHRRRRSPSAPGIPAAASTSRAAAPPSTRPRTRPGSPSPRPSRPAPASLHGHRCAPAPRFAARYVPLSE